MISNETALRECPFCGNDLWRSPQAINPRAECRTPGCFMCDRAYSLPLDGPKQVAQWNTRIARTTADGPEPVAVKALEWMRGMPGATLSRADSVVGTYRVWTHAEADGKWFWHGVNDEHASIVTSETEGQAAAQADFEARIRSAITVPADGPADAVSEAEMEAAFDAYHNTTDEMPSMLGMRAAIEAAQRARK